MSESESESTIGLFAQMLVKMKESAVANKQYLPRDAFDDLLSWENVREELAEANMDEQNLLNFIMKEAWMIFAILVQSDLVAAASELLKYKLTDEYLPVEEKKG
ncbi:hypothetical protein AOQ84DRAFT_418407 [Glonium stellatum]|uniref:Uncharacterized protein n=1 Tax=Glonium stellatum TaxID=574774 RepID=A0A8E2ERV2_9PEZI|nr:hypothetical protein AOQ84DRAFT_418407 [Glonium stellatum]